MTGNDILLICYPLLNQNGITPLIGSGTFIQAINLAINTIINYKGHLWGFQLTTEEIEAPVFNEEQLITLDYNVMGYYGTYVYINNGGVDTRMEYNDKIRRVKPGTPILTNGVDVAAFKNQLRYKITDTNIKKIRFIYYRNVPHINDLTQTIQMPDIFKNAIVYFTMSELILVYHEFEQGRDINYYNKGVQNLEWLMSSDTTLALQDIKATIV